VPPPLSKRESGPAILRRIRGETHGAKKKTGVEGYVARELAKDMRRLWKGEDAPEPWEDPAPLAKWIERLPAASREAAKTLDALVRKGRLPGTDMLNVAQYGFDFAKNGLLGKRASSYLGLTCDGDGDMYALELSTGKVVFYDHETDRLVPKRSFADLDTFFWIMVRVSAVNDGHLERKDVEPEILALAQPGTPAALAELPEEQPDEPAPAKGAKKGDRKLAKKLVDKGIVARVYLEHEKALSAFTKAIAADPSFADAHFERGNLRVGTLNDPDGVADLRRACELAPSHKKAHHELGVALEGQGDPGGAIAAYTAQLRVDPTALWSRFNCARARLAQGDRKGCKKELAELARTSKEMGGTYFDNGEGKALVTKLLRS
jgi:tetratricopeptide (TPR) repeat protein